MKFFTLAFGLLSFSAFAQIEYDMTKVELKERVSVHDLTCSIRPGSGHIENRTSTQLLNYRLMNPAIELPNNQASSQGCDMRALDKIIQDSEQFFGFAQANITILKGLAHDPRVVFGKCVKNYTEQVIIDLGSNVVLKTSSIFILKPAEGCR
jgi:hypothetical protein